MVRFSPNEDSTISRDVAAMRGSIDSHVFYRVEEIKNVSSSGYDPIYGEAYDAFTSASQVSSTRNTPFEGSIIRRSRNSEMYQQGFHSQESLTVDVCDDFDWQAGLLILFEGSTYRITNVDHRGLYSTNRVILSLDEVT